MQSVDLANPTKDQMNEMVQTPKMFVGTLKHY